jgi:hypothetical protein
MDYRLQWILFIGQSIETVRHEPHQSRFARARSFIVHTQPVTRTPASPRTLGRLRELVSPIPWSRVNNQKLSLSFKPATPADEQALQALLPEGEITDPSQLPASIPGYLIQVIPELKLEGQTIASGNPLHLGQEIDFLTRIQRPGKTHPDKVYKVPAGAYLSVNAISGGVSPQKLQDLKDRLEQTKAKLESPDQAQLAALTREDLLGDLFHAGTLGYYAQFTALGHLAASAGQGNYRLTAGYGTLGYEPKVDYFFGLPRAIQPGGVVLDIPVIHVVSASDGDKEKRRQLNLQVGMIGSALEHAVPEQMFTDPSDPTHKPDAISAVKALQKANAQGQRIYHLTPANQAQTLPNLHHNPMVMAEIRAALNAGKEVTTHTDAVSVPGWSGAGYLILDPVTGDGAYKIGGGMNGSVEKQKQLDMLIGMFAGAELALLTVSLGLVFSGLFIYLIPLILTAIIVTALFTLPENMGAFYAGLGFMYSLFGTAYAVAVESTIAATYAIVGLIISYISMYYASSDCIMLDDKSGRMYA